MVKKIVIYTRFTDPKQREESHEAQERKVRQHLDFLGIDHSNALVLRDSAKRGDLEDRTYYEQLLGMIRRGEVAILAVDQQSRFSRGFNVRSLIQDLVFYGGRFLTAAESIDTERPGWQDLVGIKEIHNQMEVRDTGWRVRRSQEQRVEKPNGSAGDFCYGYTSEYEDPVAAANYRGRGPRPFKRVVIDPAAADVVREVFRRFAIEGQSIGAIVRWWEANKSRFPAITKKKIHHEHVRRLLKNEKFIGIWKYGQTMTLRSGGGKKKQVKPSAHMKVVIVQRPDLRVVEQGVWDMAKARLARLLELYGMKENGKKRGPTEHYRLHYAHKLLDGLVHCGRCGARLHVTAGNGVKRMACPNRKGGTCPVAARVPYAAAEAAVMSVIEGVLLNYPEFLAASTAHMRSAITNLAKAVPKSLDADKSRLKQVEIEIFNLVKILATGVDSAAIRSQLSQLEREQAVLLVRIQELGEVQEAELTMPNDAWVQEQLRDLYSLLKEQSPPAIRLVRSMIGRIVSEEVPIPGKKKGFMRISFSLDGWSALLNLLSGRMPATALATLQASMVPLSGDRFQIDLGGPTMMDRWGPKIVLWRSENIPWKEIALRTGLKIANAYVVWKRWKDHRDAA